MDPKDIPAGFIPPLPVRTSPQAKINRTLDQIVDIIEDYRSSVEDMSDRQVNNLNGYMKSALYIVALLRREALSGRR